jgi:hypothetical protein
MNQDKTFYGKRKKTEKTQDRHFKQLNIPNPGNGVNPFDLGPIIPEFPKETANHPGKQELRQIFDFPPLEIRQQRRPSGAMIERLQKKNKTQPNQGKAISR